MTQSGVDEETTKEVVHVQYTGWPDHGVPESAGHLFKMMDIVERVHKKAQAPAGGMQRVNPSLSMSRMHHHVGMSMI